MRAIRLSGLMATLCTVAVVADARQPADQVTVPLTDPAGPVNLNLQLVEGGITVRGSNRRDVLVTAHARVQNRRNEGGGTGLRQLAPPPAFTVTEERNAILFVLHTPERAIDFEIEMPNRANLKLGTTAINSGIVVEGVEGELEINNPNGPITLNRVGGSIVANSVDGLVRATITSVSMQRPMAFASFNRDVDVTFPASLKANLKLRSDQGNVLTDFNLTALQQPTTGEHARREGGRVRIEINRFMYGAVNGGGPEIELRTFNGDVYVRRAQ